MKLSEKLFKNGAWFVLVPVVLLIALFVPFITMELEGVRESTSIWQMVVHNVDQLKEMTFAEILEVKHSGHLVNAPWVLILGMIAASMSGVYFMVADKKGSDAAKPFMIAGAIGTLIVLIYILFMAKDAMASSMLHNTAEFEGSTIVEGPAFDLAKGMMKELIKFGAAVWLIVLTVITGTGLSIAAYLDDQK